MAVQAAAVLVDRLEVAETIAKVAGNIRGRRVQGRHRPGGGGAVVELAGELRGGIFLGQFAPRRHGRRVLPGASFWGGSDEQLGIVGDAPVAAAGAARL